MLGIFLVGNIGKQKGSFWWPLLGCYIMTPFHILNFTSYFYTTALGILAFQVFARSWRRQIREPNTRCKQFLIIIVCFSIYLR